MTNLNVNEARVLGVLIEKAATTPEQYPLSINALTLGANQKSNRDPVLDLSEDEVFDAVESLRAKGLVIRVDQAGARVQKYRHHAGETLRCRAAELAVLAELLVRGPQTLGELRGRAVRMAEGSLQSLDDARAMIRALSDRPEPLVKQIAPSPGSRAERYVQLLCPDARADETGSADEAKVDDRPGVSMTLSERVTKLESDVERLNAMVKKLSVALGEPVGEE